MNYKLHNDERETILLFNQADGYWDVSTSVLADMNKFRKLGWELIIDNGYELTFRVPRNAITFRNIMKLKDKKPQTDEQKRANAERMKAMREKRKNPFENKEFFFSLEILLSLFKNSIILKIVL